MAIEGARIAVRMNAGQRVTGLNHIAAIRGHLLGGHCGDELSRFLADMRDPRDPQARKNQRALSALFFLARIRSERHGCDYHQLTKGEQRALTEAMNHLRAVVSLFPKKLTLTD